MPLLDSHCHLEAKDFRRDDGSDERDDVLARARAAGVEAFVCVGSGASLDEVRTAVAMAEAHPDIWAAVGIHPHDAARIPEGTLAEIERLATHHPRVVAVGETGLDYHYMHSPEAEQQRTLRDFIAIARRAKKPLSLHIRDAHADAVRILQSDGASEVGGVIHCFTGDARRRQALRGARLSHQPLGRRHLQERQPTSARLPPGCRSIGCWSRPTAPSWRRSRCAESVMNPLMSRIPRR